jgi:hypothetical protein
LFLCLRHIISDLTASLHLRGNFPQAGFHGLGAGIARADSKQEKGNCGVVLHGFLIIGYGPCLSLLQLLGPIVAICHCDKRRTLWEMILFKGKTEITPP